MRLLWSVTLGLGGAVVLLNASLYLWRAVRQYRSGASSGTGDALGIADAVWAFTQECAATAAVILLIPIGWVLPRCRSGAGHRGPLMLLHGWGLNRGSLWLLQHRLVRDGWSPVGCFDYRSLAADVGAAAARLGPAVDRLARAAPDCPVALVGHSLGGLVLRYYLQHSPAPHVRRIVTLGTPHQGSELARLLPAARARLAPGSALLHTLNAADRVRQQFDVIAIRSAFDAIVLPPENAEYPGAFTVSVSGVGHNALLFSSKIYHLLAENLSAPLC
ncbi:MAG: lipase family alpha/beta hydrolase [Candidatus Binatia bacterium]